MVRAAASLTDLYAPGTWALVTGASAGLGVLFAEAFAKRGCNLILAARSVDKMVKVKADIEAKVASSHPQFAKTLQIVCIRADLGTSDGAMKLVGEIKQKGIAPLIVCNNAGSGLFGDLDGRSEEQIMQEMNLMTTSVVFLSRAFLPDMKAAHRGGILNIASIASWLPMPWGSIYAGSKGFTRNFSSALHAELKGTHPRVRCTVSCPGPVLTDIWEKAGGIDGSFGKEIGIVEDAETVVARTMRAFENDHNYVITGWILWAACHTITLVPTWIPDMIARQWIKRMSKGSGAVKEDQTPVELKVKQIQ